MIKDTMCTGDSVLDAMLAWWNHGHRDDVSKQIRKTRQSMTPLRRMETMVHVNTSNIKG